MLELATVVPDRELQEIGKVLLDDRAQFRELRLDRLETAMNRGAFDFLTKPIEFQDLEVTIRKTLTHLADAVGGEALLIDVDGSMRAGPVSASSSSGIALIRPSITCHAAFCVPSAFLNRDMSAPSSHMSGMA